MPGKSDIGPFAIVPRWVREACKGEPYASVLYECLADHADRTTDDGWTIGRQQLAKEAGCSMRTIDKAVAHLEAIGALEVTRQTRGPENIWSRYFIRTTMPGVVQNLHGVVQKTTPGGAENDTLPIEPPTRTPSMELGDAFTDFWLNYPRKIGKPAASKAWKKVKPGEYLAVMLGLSVWVKYWADRETADDYIPHPASWLNDRRWETLPTPGPLRKIDITGGRRWDERRKIWLEPGVG